MPNIQKSNTQKVYAKKEDVILTAQLRSAGEMPYYSMGDVLNILHSNTTGVGGPVCEGLVKVKGGGCMYLAYDADGKPTIKVFDANTRQQIWPSLPPIHAAKATQPQPPMAG